MPDEAGGILSKLVDAALAATRERQRHLPIERVLAAIPEAAPLSFMQALSTPAINIIAEIKYASPGKGRNHCSLPPGIIGRMYAGNGAAAVSVLTERRYFQGSLESLSRLASEGLPIPILRKDFIVDDYQVAEARAAGASSYLLIAALLAGRGLSRLIGYGRQLRMEPLVEVHNLREMEAALKAGARIIGVNNRNLGDLSISLDTSFALAREVEGSAEVVLVSESGISRRSQLLELRDAGFHGFLVGTALMAAPDPGVELSKLLRRTHVH